MTELLVTADGTAIWRGRSMRCAIGRSGVVTAAEKREGDGATPLGSWLMRGLLYRPDQLPDLVTQLPFMPIGQQDGWCDAPGDPNYNRPVRHPYPASAERLWRDDHVYDFIVPLGYNDAPVVPGKGSAIFLHCATPDYTPTEGCVALSHADLLDVLRDATLTSVVKIVETL